MNYGRKNSRRDKFELGPERKAGSRHENQLLIRAFRNFFQQYPSFFVFVFLYFLFTQLFGFRFSIIPT